MAPKFGHFILAKGPTSLARATQKLIIRCFIALLRFRQPPTLRKLLPQGNSYISGYINTYVGNFSQEHKMLRHPDLSGIRFMKNEMRIRQVIKHA